MFQNSPKDPLGSDLLKAVGSFIFGILCIIIGNWRVAIIFFLLTAFWGWHYTRLKKKYDEALEKREKHFAQMYGYENDSSDEEEYF